MDRQTDRQTDTDILRKVQLCFTRYQGYQIRENETEHVECMREMRNAYKILVGKPEASRSQ